MPRTGAVLPSRPDRGAAAVEFALVSMLLIPLLLGMLSFGLIIWGHQAADHAAREGARLAAVGVTNCADWKAQVHARAGSIVNTTTMAGTGATYSVAGAQQAGDQITVTINYAIPGSPGWMLTAATAILPGASTVTLPDGSGTRLQVVAYSRNEASSNPGCPT